VDKKLFKELLQLVLNLPDFGSKLAAVDIDSSSTSTSETFVRLEPSDFLLRLSAALRACG
ncbi:MAG: Clp protease, partial [Citrobacter freundii]|nr:Clp protease [Citrobacter freundii]